MLIKDYENSITYIKKEKSDNTNSNTHFYNENGVEDNSLGEFKSLAVKSILEKAKVITKIKCDKSNKPLDPRETDPSAIERKTKDLMFKFKQVPEIVFNNYLVFLKRRTNAAFSTVERDVRNG
jgi:hypothetical protein